MFTCEARSKYTALVPRICHPSCTRSSRIETCAKERDFSWATSITVSWDTYLLDLSSDDCKALRNERIRIGHPQLGNMRYRPDFLEVSNEFAASNLKKTGMKSLATVFRTIPLFSSLHILGELIRQKHDPEFVATQEAKTIRDGTEIELKTNVLADVYRLDQYFSEKTRAAENPVRGVIFLH